MSLFTTIILHIILNVNSQALRYNVNYDNEEDADEEEGSDDDDDDDDDDDGDDNDGACNHMVVLHHLAAYCT